MKCIVRKLLTMSTLSLSLSTASRAQNTSADQFLESVSEHSTGAQAEQDHAVKASNALNTASPAEAARVLPVVLHYTHTDNQPRVRQYATMFLLIVAIRPDGAQLLSSTSKDVSSLLVDPDPEIQKGAVAVTDYVIAKSETDKQPYLSALLAAIQNPHTPQEVVVEMAGPLLIYDAGNPNAVKAVLDFMHRSDLTESTRMGIVSSLAPSRDLPKEVGQSLVKELDDPSLRVRAAAIIAFSNSYFGYSPLARDRVAKMANDPAENPRVRALAREALAGHSPLNPNIELTPYAPIVASH